jgi:hypothetical protein
MTSYKPQVISENDADYLYEIRENFPVFGNNIGTALVGSDFAVIGFSLIPRFYILKEPENETNKDPQPFIWFAESYKRTGMRKGISILGDIANCLGQPCMTVITPNERDIFHRQIQKEQEGIFAHPLRAFTKAGHKEVPIGELYLSVLDDIESGDIHIAPEFKSRPAYEHMNSQMVAAEFADNTATALQKAFVTSLATWSYKRQRPPFQVGASTFEVY